MAYRRFWLASAMAIVLPGVAFAQAQPAPADQPPAAATPDAAKAPPAPPAQASGQGHPPPPRRR